MTLIDREEIAERIFANMALIEILRGTPLASTLAEQNTRLRAHLLGLSR